MSERRASDGRQPPPAGASSAFAEPRRHEHPGLLQRVPVILYTADAGEAGRWYYVSPQIETILGFTAEEWCADRDMWARQLHPDDAERVLADEAEFADGAMLSSPLEYRLLHRDGHAVWLRDDALMVEGEDGVRRWHGVLSDVTDQKDAEAELALRAAQQAAVARLGEHALEGASATDLIAEAIGAATACWAWSWARWPSSTPSHRPSASLRGCPASASTSWCRVGLTHMPATRSSPAGRW